MSVLKHRITAVLAGSALVVGIGATGAVAGNLITSRQIEDGTIRSVDVKDESLRLADLRPSALERLSGSGTNGTNGVDGTDGTNGTNGTNGTDGATGPQGAAGLANVESDGPYPGASQLTQGANSSAYVTANGESQTVWVQCAPGKVALGGGFTLAADAGQAAAEAVTVIESAPTQIAEGAEVYNPIEGDPDGSFQANAWKVVAINDGTSDVIVRPHVVCATVAD